MRSAEMNEDNHYARIGEALRHLREAAGLSQKDVSHRCGWKTEANVSRIEQPLSNPRADSVGKVLDALGCSATELGIAIDRLSGRDPAYFVARLGSGSEVDSFMAGMTEDLVRRVLDRGK